LTQAKDAECCVGATPNTTARAASLAGAGPEALTRQGRDLFQTPEILKNDPENFLHYTSYT
jgi:hypothetical protein